MASQSEEEVFFHTDSLLVAETELHGCKGFALHIGSSIVKLAYIGDIDRHETMNPELSKATINLCTATSANLDKVFQFIKENLYDDRNHVGHKFYYQAILTGYHAMQYKEKLDKLMPGMTIKLTDTFTAYTKYHQFGVMTIGRPTFLHHVVKCPSKSEPSTSDDVMKLIANQKAESGIEGPGTDFPKPYDQEYYQSIKKEFPYLLCAIGGDVTYLKVTASGRAEPCVLQRSGYGGASFHALAKLITGKQNYRELLKLANRGDYRAPAFARPVTNFPELSTDCHVQHEGVLDEEVVLAGGGEKDVVLKPMDKIITEDTTKPEDSLAALMYMTCERIVTHALTLARKENIRKVYFAGAFCEENSIFRECVKNSPVYDMRNTGPDLYVGLTKHGMYAGALGALLDGLHMMQFFVVCTPMCRPALH